MIARWPSIRLFAIIGAICIVAGGLVAAMTRPTGFELGSWTAAFLVLIGGAAQITLAVGQSWLALEHPPARRVHVEVVFWNIGVVGTIAGTLLGSPIVTTVAGCALIPALALFIVTTGSPSLNNRVVRLTYQVLVGIVLVSIPIGLGLSWSRHS